MTTNRKFRFGVTGSTESSAASLTELARKAEDLGYSTLLASDHMGRHVSPLISSMAVLAATTRLRAGTLVLSNPLHNPAILAKEIASVDLLSNGRFEPGLGAGWPITSRTGRADAEQTGIDMGSSQERVERLAESVAIIKRFLSSEEPFDYTGRHHNSIGLIPSPPVVQRPHPPILVAGAGPSIIRLAAKEADIINIAPRPPIRGETSTGAMGFGLTMADEISLIKEAAGERYADIEISVSSSNIAITNEPGPFLEKFAAGLHVSPEVAMEMPATLIGDLGSIRERIQMHRDEYDISYRVVPAHAMEQFAPIVAQLAGS
jgi:probable F420-dependent oxidoreductase